MNLRHYYPFETERLILFPAYSITTIFRSIFKTLAPSIISPTLIDLPFMMANGLKSLNTMPDSCHTFFGVYLLVLFLLPALKGSLPHPLSFITATLMVLSILPKEALLAADGACRLTAGFEFVAVLICDFGTKL